MPDKSKNVEQKRDEQAKESKRGSSPGRTPAQKKAGRASVAGGPARAAS